MATVIYMPEDKRWSSMGEGLGQGAVAFQQRRREKEEEMKQQIIAQQRKQAYEQALSTASSAMSEEKFNPGKTYEALASSLVDAGAPDQLDDMMKAIMDSRAEKVKQQTQEQYLEGLPEDSPLRKRLAGPGKKDLGTAKDLAAIEKSLQPEKEKPVGERSVKIYNSEQGEQEAFVPKNIPPEQIGEYIKQTHGPGWSMVKPKEKDKDVTGERSVKIFDDKGREQEAFVPKSVAPAEVNSFIKSAYGQQWSAVQPKEKEEEKKFKPTEGDKDVSSILTLRGIEPDKASPKERAGARNVVNNQKEASRYLAQIYGGDIVSDTFGNIMVEDFGSAEEEIKWRLANEEIDDFLFQGNTAQEAGNKAEARAEVKFKTGEGWVPERIKNSSPEEMKEFLDSRGVESPEVQTYLEAERMVRVYFDSPDIGARMNPDSVRKAARVVLKTRNPDASESEIERELREMFGE